MWEIVGMVKGRPDDPASVDDVVYGPKLPVIFVDTSFWIAATSEDDAHHDEARRLSRRADALLVTTNHVRGETWTFLNRRHGHGPAAAVDHIDEISYR